MGQNRLLQLARTPPRWPPRLPTPHPRRLSASLPGAPNPGLRPRLLASSRNPAPARRAPQASPVLAPHQIENLQSSVCIVHTIKYCKKHVFTSSHALSSRGYADVRMEGHTSTSLPNKRTVPVAGSLRCIRARASDTIPRPQHAKNTWRSCTGPTGMPHNSMRCNNRSAGLALPACVYGCGRSLARRSRIQSFTRTRSRVS